jgi:hypothetical protein
MNLPTKAFFIKNSTSSGWTSLSFVIFTFLSLVLMHFFLWHFCAWDQPPSPWKPSTGEFVWSQKPIGKRILKTWPARLEITTCKVMI